MVVIKSHEQQAYWEQLRNEVGEPIFDSSLPHVEDSPYVLRLLRYATPQGIVQIFTATAPELAAQTPTAA